MAGTCVVRNTCSTSIPTVHAHKRRRLNSALFVHPLIINNQKQSSDARYEQHRISATPSISSSSIYSEPAEIIDTQHAHDSDTIAALVTATQGAVSIIRLSGPDSVDIASQIFQLPSRKSSDSNGTNFKKTWSPESHRVYYGNAIDPVSHSLLDEVLVLVMLGPRSYTAEDVVEIHTHGGGVCAQRVLRACISAGARLARPGEFTLRAFLNGRLDLSQAESVAQLVDARTVAAADTALAGLSGGLGREVSDMRMACLELVAELEARLDFDEDLPPMVEHEVVDKIRALKKKLEAALATARHGQLVRTGIQVAIIGRPNVGKSSLLNALSGVDKAIVTDIAGTTRDVVEAGVVIGGIPITLLDTAGVRESTDQVEKIGVERSVAAARQADVVVMVADGRDGWSSEEDDVFRSMFHGGDNAGSSSGSGSDLEGSRVAASSDDSLNASEYMHNSSDMASGSSQSINKTIAAPSLLVLNKVDLSGANGSSTTGGSDVPEYAASAFSAIVKTSALTGQGLGDLREALLKLAGAPELTPGGIAWAINERQSEALTRALEALQRVEESVQGGLPIDFWTIDLRAGLMALGEVSGDDVTEQVLDTVFSKFCIGK